MGSFMELWKKLKTADKPIVLYGMGNGADRILDIMEARGIAASGVFASDGFVRHQLFRGFTVCSYKELKERFGEMIVLVGFGTHRQEVMENIRHTMCEQEVYAPDVPVAGDTLFDSAFLECHRAEFKSVYSMLADDFSKKTFENVIHSKLSGEIKPLFDCETTYEEAVSLLDLSERECYLDLGAYTGDTVERFLSTVHGRYERIVAVEPDQKNFNRLLKNTQGMERVFCHNCCVDEKSGVRLYAMDGGRKSHSLSQGGSLINAVSVDELIGEDRISYIKMDIEGMEAAALCGAAGTIRKNKPAMQIAAYHRSEDLFELPLLVQQICPGAKVFLRHLSCLPAWDTDFYFKF